MPQSRPLLLGLLALLAACASGADSATLPTDADGDGFVAADDCDDADAAVHPGAEERCDGVDNDCSGEVDDAPSDGLPWYRDADGDGYSGALDPVVACDPPAGYGFEGGDCDDADPAVHPHTPELCNGLDDNCNGVATGEEDGDGDGVLHCDGDCDDANPDAFPDAPEVCDRSDNDCDGQVDEDPVWFADADHDGYGAPSVSVAAACDARPAGYAPNDDDCDDTNHAVRPSAIEVCDAADVDDDCDGLADDADDSVSTDTQAPRYPDADGDGYGEKAAQFLSCEPPRPGFTESDGDCDDTDAAVSPVAAEVCGDGLDNDCDGLAECGVAGHLDVSSAIAALRANDPYNHSSVNVSRAGDVNADGYADLLVGDSLDSEGGFDAGAAFVVYGPVAGDLDLAAAGEKLVGEHEEDHAGYPVSAAGDVNGDGYADLLVGASGCDDGGTDAGAAYVVFGPVSGDLPLALADARLLGEDAGDHAGSAVSGAGDVDGDGYADLLVGAYRHDGGGTDAGAAYLVFGPVSGDLDLSLANARFMGEEEENEAGWAVAAAGDVDGDGSGDLLIGSYTHSVGGAAYLVYAPTSGDLDLSLADARLLGEDKGDSAGYAGAGAGDINADGYADVLVGAPGRDEGGSYAGAVYLVQGPVTGDLDLAAADARYIGEDEEDRAGQSVSGAADVDGDGYDDLIIGARGDDDGGKDAGAAYVVYGPTSGALDLSLADAKVVGGEAWEDLGQSVSGADDVNADGYPDLLVASSNTAYLLYGGIGP